MVIMAMTSFLNAQDQANNMSPAEFQKQLNIFNQSQNFPLTNSNHELFRLGDVTWQRMAGEYEYYLAPMIKDIDAYNKRIRAFDNKATGIVKSVWRIVRIPLDQNIKALLAPMNIRVPDYYTKVHLNVLLPVIDIEFLLDKGIDIQILDTYGNKPVTATDNTATNVVIWSEGWEGDMAPYTIGNVTGSPSTNWKDVNCASYSGNWSLWCAGGGTQPQPWCAAYVNDMNTYIYKTLGVDTRAYTNVKFKFNYKHQMETGYDFFNYYTSIDGVYWVISQSFTGTSAGYPTTWQSYETAAFGEIWTLYFKFEFTSDVSNVWGGAYIDNLQVTGDDDCNSTMAYGSLLTPTDTWNYDFVSYVGGYWLFSVSAGTQYHFSLCPEQFGDAGMFDSELILRKESDDAILAYNDDVCGDDARISWTADFTGNVKLVMKKYHCTNWFPPGLGIARLTYKSGPLENPYLNASPVFMNFNPDTYWTYPASLQQITVTSNINLEWTVTTSESWILLPAGFTGGTGSATFNITCANNNGLSTRAGMVTFNSPLGNQTIYISQRAGCSSSSNYNSDTSAYYTVTENWQYLENMHAGQYARFYMPRGFLYHFSLCPEHGGDSPYDSQLTIWDSNDNVEAYSDDDCGDDAIASRMFSPIGLVSLQYKVTVTQYNCLSNSTNTRLAYKSGPMENPWLAVSPDYFSVTTAAGSGTFAISSNTTWSLSDNASWLSVSPVNGAGFTTITVDWQENTGESRTGTITASAYGMAPVTVTVYQAGFSPIPMNLVLWDNFIDDNVCFAAYQTITVAGAGHYYEIMETGHVELVAGEKILLLPDTRVYGYLFAHISTSGIYCPGSKNALSTLNDGNSFNQGGGAKDVGQFFKIYPNPNSGKFTLELMHFTDTDPFSVEIYGMWGEKSICTGLPAGRKCEIDLSGKPAGLYLLRVSRAGRSGYEKVIINR